MKHRSVAYTETPKGYTGKNFNNWAKYIHKTSQKLNGTKVNKVN